MKSPLVKIGEWLPDQPENNNPGATNIQNVLVQGENYKPAKSFQETSGAVSTDSRVFGEFSFVDNAGTVHNFVGTQHKIYTQAGSTWADVSSTSGYTTPDDGQWKFCSFGQRVIATNFADPIQNYLVGSTIATFTQLSTSAPKARDIATVNNFVIASYIDDGTIRPNRQQWCAFEDPTDWTNTSISNNQADFQDLEGDGGANTRTIEAQNYATVIQERAIWRQEYVGYPDIFQFTKAEQNRGTNAQNSVVSDGVLIYYYSDNGFMVFDGTKSTPIGQNKIDRYFANRLDKNYLDRIKGAVDPVNKLIAWAYPAIGNNLGNPTDVICYHWVEGKWSNFQVSLESIATLYTSGYTLESLGLVYPVLENVPFSFDSRVWSGGNRTLGGFSTNHKLGFFDGPNLAATLETSETALNPGGRAFVSSVLPVTDSANVTATIKSRKRQFDDLTLSPVSIMDTNTNEIPFRVDDRYHRVALNISAGSTWSLVQGVEFNARASGRI